MPSAKKASTQPNKILMGLAVGVFIALALGVVFLQRQTQESQDIRQQAAVDDGIVQVMPGPIASNQIVANQPAYFDLYVHTQGANITGVQMQFTIQSTVANNFSVTAIPDSGLSIMSPIITPNGNETLIQFVALPATAQPYSSSTQKAFARISFTPTGAGTLAVQFDRANSLSTIYGANPPEDELLVNNFTLTVQSIPTPTPSTPTPTPTATPPVPTIAPPSLTPTPTATPGVGGPTPTPTTTSPTPTATPLTPCLADSSGQPICPLIATPICDVGYVVVPQPDDACGCDSPAMCVPAESTPTPTPSSSPEAHYFNLNQQINLSFFSNVTRLIPAPYAGENVVDAILDSNDYTVVALNPATGVVEIAQAQAFVFTATAGEDITTQVDFSHSGGIKHRSAVYNSDGTRVHDGESGYTFTPAQTQDYYLIIYSFQNPPYTMGVSVYDPTGWMTASPSPSPEVCAYETDLTGEGDVNIFDYSIFVAEYGTHGVDIPSDIDCDGDVDIMDYSALLNDYRVN